MPRPRHTSVLEFGYFLGVFFYFVKNYFVSKIASGTAHHALILFKTCTSILQVSATKEKVIYQNVLLINRLQNLSCRQLKTIGISMNPTVTILRRSTSSKERDTEKRFLKLRTLVYISRDGNGVNEAGITTCKNLQGVNND